jgi:S1-C subfamily serine protease
MKQSKSFLVAVIFFAGNAMAQPSGVLHDERAGGPADEAGLQKGDRVVELAGRQVRDIYDLMYVLREVKPGEEGNVIVERGEERIESTVVFSKSTRTR